MLRIFCASARKISPAGVGTTPREVLRKSFVPSSLSYWERNWEREGWAIISRSAAPRMEPVS